MLLAEKWWCDVDVEMVLRLLAFVLLELHVFAFVAIKWKCRFVDW